MVKSSVRLSILLLSLVFGISIVSLSASANPMAMDPFEMLSVWAFMMLAANFPVNLFWYLLALRIDAKRWGMKMGDLPRDTGTFGSLVLFAVFMVTLVGAVIDLIFIIPSYSYYGGVNMVSVSIGMILIFASVLFASMTVLRMRIYPSLVAGTVLAAVNPLFWGFMRSFGWSQIFLFIPVLFLILAAIAFHFMASWHSKTNEEIPADYSEASQEHEKGHRMRVRRDAIISVIIFLLLLVPIIISAFSFPPSYYHMTPVIASQKSSDATNWKWQITAIGGGPILKSDVYVQLMNASGYVIQTEMLTTASGTHGFSYTPASSVDHVSVGDLFRLSKDYTIGCTMTLVTPGAAGQYCLMTI